MSTRTIVLKGEGGSNYHLHMLDYYINKEMYIKQLGVILQKLLIRKFYLQEVERYIFFRKRNIGLVVVNPIKAKIIISNERCMFSV